MSDLAIETDSPQISRREWVVAASPSSMTQFRHLSSTDIAFATRHGGTRWAPASNKRWVQEVGDQLDKLRALEEDWDTYGSPPLSTLALDLTERLLDQVRSLAPPVPRLSGTSEGGVTFEWTNATLELIIEVDPLGEVSALVKDVVSGAAGEGSLVDLSELLSRALASLSLAR